MIVKEISHKDIDTMVEIERSNFSDPWDYKTLYYEVIKNETSIFFGVYLEDVLVGYIGFWATIDNLDIINIAITNYYIRQGSGGVLFDIAEIFAKKLKLSTITLEVNINNHTALKLYDKKGFKTIRTIRNYYTKTGDDAYLMQKEVNYE